MTSNALAAASMAMRQAALARQAGSGDGEQFLVVSHQVLPGRLGVAALVARAG